MTFMEKFYQFFNSIFSRISGNAIENVTPQLASSSEVDQATSSNLSENELSEDSLEERINIAKRTLLTKLYSLEQEIAIFESDFPNEYNEFFQRIESLRASYNSSLDELKKLLTFEIDPDTDTTKIGEVVRLEKDIHNFIESTVKFHIISKRLQQLIKKLYILYNVSIFHSKECEREKVCTQLEYAIQSERKIAEEFKDSYYILADRQLKERVIELLSYVDYEIFKSSIRSSSIQPKDLLIRSVMMTNFEEFDYVTAYIAFIKDELSDLIELLPLISDEECYKVLKKKSEKLLAHLTYSENLNAVLLEPEFWEEIFAFESNLLEMLKMNGVEKEKLKVKLIGKMDITVVEKDVLVSPVANANVALVGIFATTHDERVLLLIKLLKNVSKDTTYKEIYFLSLLFDAIEVIQNTPNDLINHLNKYITKYPYNKKTIIKRKQEVIDSSNKEYVVIFSLDNYAEEIVKTLKNLNFDFKVVNGNVFINSFYFNGLNNVLSSLKTNTQNL